MWVSCLWFYKGAGKFCCLGFLCFVVGALPIRDRQSVAAYTPGVLLWVPVIGILGVTIWMLGGSLLFVRTRVLFLALVVVLGLTEKTRLFSLRIAAHRSSEGQDRCSSDKTAVQTLCLCSRLQSLYMAVFPVLLVTVASSTAPPTNALNCHSREEASQLGPP